MVTPESTHSVTMLDLVAVIYSAGKVFDGLSTGRLDTLEFIRSGSVAGVSSRADLALLEDLRDAAQHVIVHAGDRVTPELIRSINASMIRSGALHPGEFRTAEQAIGVSTPYGRHTPPAVNAAMLAAIINERLRGRDAIDEAIGLFIDVASAQPFEDGNKRTALFAANAALLARGEQVLLTVPVDDEDPEIARQFNDLLARAYIFGERDGLVRLMKELGVINR